MSEDGELQKVMGFSGFGGRKTAMKFDLEKMFEETRRTAREYSQQVTGACRLILACCLCTQPISSDCKRGLSTKLVAIHTLMLI